MSEVAAGRESDAAQPPQQRKLFFALWPDAATRGAIERAVRDAVRSSGGRPTAKRNLHLTVAFLGDVDADGLERALAAPPVDCGPIDLTLDRLGHWRAPRVLWLAPSTVPPGLIVLEDALWTRLAAAGFEREEREYAPHVTLARRARSVTDAITPVTWTATSLTLVESISLPHGVHYEPLHDWSLGAAAPDPLR